MKNLIFLALLAVLTFSCSSKQTSQESTTKVTAVANKTVSLDVEGMTCTGCENTIKEAVGSLPGVSEVTASHTEGLSVVKFDSTLTDIQLISNAITEAGYVVKGEKTNAVPPSGN